MTTYLPDVNIWLALASRRHIHNQVASQWLQSVDQERVAFCRITQMGLLRLLTNSKVMGADVVSRGIAWDVYAQIHLDSRVTFLSEPGDGSFDDQWRTLSQSPSPAPLDWTDAYLLAFAQSHHLTFVTFDQDFKTLTAPAVLVLTPG